MQQEQTKTNTEGNGNVGRSNDGSGVAGGGGGASVGGVGTGAGAGVNVGEIRYGFGILVGRDGREHLGIDRVQRVGTRMTLFEEGRRGRRSNA